MPAQRARSPIAAIQQWLSNTGNNSAEHASIEGIPAHDTASHCRSDMIRPSAHHGHGRSLSSTGDAGHRQSREEELHTDARAKIAATASNRMSGEYQAGLAERLGLHAPFRTFGDDGTLDRPIDAPQRNVKQRRTAPSSSLLEPAVVIFRRRQQVTPPHHMNENEKKRKYHDFQGHSLDHSDSGSMTPDPPTNATKTYERRSRHKTREDRYDLKQSARKWEKKQQKKDDAAGKQKKRKRREKSGNTLMHDFAASNVAQDRLTMRPAASVGLFGKGRASSPVRRKGLPDLTFSEMTFHRSRREQPEATKERVKERPKRQKKDRTADTEADISRYFISKVPKPHKDQEIVGSDDLRNPSPATGQRSHGAHGSPRSPLDPVELPDRPFLGFGSSGISLTSPMKPANRPQIHQATLDSSPKYPPSIGATSYINWSLTHRSASHPQTPSVRSCSHSMTVPREAALHPHGQSQHSKASKAQGTDTMYFAERGIEPSSLSPSIHGEERRKRLQDITSLDITGKGKCSKRKSLKAQSQTVEIMGSATQYDLNTRLPSGKISKPTAEQVLAQEGLRIDQMMPPIKEPSGSADSWKPSLLLDAALENLLQTCHKGFGSSTLSKHSPSGAGGPNAQNEPATPRRKPVEDQDVGTITSKQYGRTDNALDIPEELYRFSKDQGSFSGDGDNLPTAPVTVYLRELRNRDTQESAYISSKLQALPHDFPTLWNSPSNMMTVVNPTQQNAHLTSSSAWNAYQNLYETQLGKLSSKVFQNEGEWRDDNGWDEDPYPAAQTTARKASLSGLPRSNGTGDRYMEELGYDNLACDTRDKEETYEQLTPFEEELAQPYELDDGLEDIWDGGNEGLPVDADIFGLHTQGYQAYLPAPWSLATKIEPTVTEYEASPARSAEGLTHVNGTIDQSHDQNRSTGRDVQWRDRQPTTDFGDNILSDFWKPNRLY